MTTRAMRLVTAFICAMFALAALVAGMVLGLDDKALAIGFACGWVVGIFHVLNMQILRGK